MKALTTMQAAYWVGRQSASPRRHGRPPVCGIRRRRAGSRPTAPPSMRCTCVIRCCACALPMMAARRSRLPAPGTPCISTTGGTPIQRRWQPRSPPNAGKSTQLLPLEQGVPCDISLSLLPEGRSRLHVDLDMIAGDAMSFRLLMEDLTAFYHQCPPVPFHDAPPAYFDHLAQRDADEALRQRRERGQRWWRERPRRCHRRRACCARRSAAAAIARHTAECRGKPRAGERRQTAPHLALDAVSHCSPRRRSGLEHDALSAQRAAVPPRERTGGRASPHRRFL